MSRSSSKSETSTITGYARPVDSVKKIGLERFLQLHPQKYIVAVMMRTLFKNRVMTEAEWLELLDRTLNTIV